MLDIALKQIDRVGWAGHYLWLITKDNYSIHLYDGNIVLNTEDVDVGQDLSLELLDKIVNEIQIFKDKFLIRFSDEMELEVSSEKHETARVFKKGEGNPHYIYQNGMYFES